MISYGAAVPGGIFMPILVLGAILGGFAGCLMIRFGLIPAKAYINLVVIGMAAYFGAIEMAPFTAICLLTEMVGTIQQILPMLLVTFIAYTVNDLLGDGQSMARCVNRWLPRLHKNGMPKPATLIIELIRLVSLQIINQSTLDI